MWTSSGEFGKAICEFRLVTSISMVRIYLASASAKVYFPKLNVGVKIIPPQKASPLVEETPIISLTTYKTSMGLLASFKTCNLLFIANPPKVIEEYDLVLNCCQIVIAANSQTYKLPLNKKVNDKFTVHFLFKSMRIPGNHTPRLAFQKIHVRP